MSEWARCRVCGAEVREEEMEAHLKHHHPAAPEAGEALVREADAGCRTAICMCCGKVFTGDPRKEEDVARIIRESQAHDRVCEKNPLAAEVKGLKEELAEAYADILCGRGILEKHGRFAGWWFSAALSDTTRAGNRLCEMGLYEKHPESLGRMCWFRKKALAASAGPKEGAKG